MRRHRQQWTPTPPTFLPGPELEDLPVNLATGALIFGTVALGAQLTMLAIYGLEDLAFTAMLILLAMFFGCIGALLGTLSLVRRRMGRGMAAIGLGLSLAGLATGCATFAAAMP